jgi:hypothetical protein
VADVGAILNALSPMRSAMKSSAAPGESGHNSHIARKLGGRWQDPLTAFV